MQISARDILAKTIQAEAGNQGPVGMLSVGSVIMNRLMSGNYPNKLHDVILQPGQFSAWNKTTGYADGLQGQDMSFTPSDAAYSIADQLLDTNYNDPTGGATHFYNPAISNPAWGKTAGGNWKTIGDHVFGTPANKDTTMSTILNNAPVIAATSNNPTSQQPMSGMNSNPLFKMLGNAVGGGFDQLKNAVTGRDPDAADRLAIGLMTLSGQPQQFAPLMQLAANDIQERKKRRQRNASLEYLAKIDPELAKLATNDPSLLTNIMSSVMSQQLKGKKTIMSAAQILEQFGQSVPEGTYEVTVGRDNKPTDISPINPKTTDPTSVTRIDLALKDSSKKGANYGAAVQSLAKLDLLEGLLDVSEQGFLPGLAQFAFENFGVDKRSDTAAAAAAIINQIVPSMRPAGSGPMSDADLAMFKASAPSIAAKPGGNKLIIKTLKGIAKYERDFAEIHQNFASGIIETIADRDKAIRALEDPMKEAAAWMKANGIYGSSPDDDVTVTDEELEFLSKE